MLILFHLFSMFFQLSIFRQLQHENLNWKKGKVGGKRKLKFWSWLLHESAGIIRRSIGYKAKGQAINIAGNIREVNRVSDSWSLHHTKCYMCIWASAPLSIPSNTRQTLFWSLCMLSRLSPIWLFAPLWTVACQAPLSMGFRRQEYWSGSPCPLPVSWLLHWQVRSLALAPPGKPFDLCVSVCVCVCLCVRAHALISYSVVSDSLWCHGL